MNKDKIDSGGTPSMKLINERGPLYKLCKSLESRNEVSRYFCDYFRKLIARKLMKEVQKAQSREKPHPGTSEGRNREKIHATTPNKAQATCDYTGKYKRFFKFFLKIRTDDADSAG